jgi:hypothetical protein
MLTFLRPGSGAGRATQRRSHTHKQTLARSTHQLAGRCTRPPLRVPRPWSSSFPCAGAGLRKLMRRPLPIHTQMQPCVTPGVWGTNTSAAASSGSRNQQTRACSGVSGVSGKCSTSASRRGSSGRVRSACSSKHAPATAPCQQARHAVRVRTRCVPRTRRPSAFRRRPRTPWLKTRSSGHAMRRCVWFCCLNRGALLYRDAVVCEAKAVKEALGLELLAKAMVPVRSDRVCACAGVLRRERAGERTNATTYRIGSSTRTSIRTQPRTQRPVWTRCLRHCAPRGPTLTT